MNNEDGVGPIRPGPSAQNTRREQEETIRWAMGLGAEQASTPLLSVMDVVNMLKQAKECVAAGVRDTVPPAIPVYQRPLFIKAMGDVGQSACDFLGYGLIEACRMRMKAETAKGCPSCGSKPWTEHKPGCPGIGEGG